MDLRLRGLFYFAYCANMNNARMLYCIDPKAKRIGPTAVPDKQLVFDDFTETWQGTVASMIDKKGCSVHGMIWEIDPCLKPKLYKLMGVEEGIYMPIKFHHKVREVTQIPMPVTTFVLRKKYEGPYEDSCGNVLMSMRPSKIYKDLMVDGAYQSCVPVWYFKALCRLQHNGYTGSVKPKLC